MRRSYPYESVVRVRQQAASERARELTIQQQSVQIAQEEVARVREALALARSQQARALQEERQRLIEGRAQVQDLILSARYREGSERELARLREDCAKLERRLAAAEEAELAAERKLREALAEQRVIERHREGFEEQARAAAECAEDERATEAWVNRGRGGR